MKIVITLMLCSYLGFAQNYQIGKTWDRLPIHSSANWLKQMAGSIAEVGSTATAFYLGKGFVLTNAHVCPNIKTCHKRRVEFPYFRNKKGDALKGYIAEILLVQPHLDFSLLRVRFVNSHTFKRLPLPLKLSKQKPRTYQKLSILGYGSFRNEYGILMSELSNDCRVWSRSPLIKKQADPDQINPFPYKVWSFLIGCDVSHGDSGSPIFDSKTKDVIGLLWTGVMPKASIIRKVDLYKFSEKFLWSQLNYAVPTYLIRRHIKQKYPNILN